MNLRLTKQDTALSTLNETNTKAKQRLLNQVGRKCRMKFENAALITTLVFMLCFMYFKMLYQKIRLTVHCNLELFIESHKAVLSPMGNSCAQLWAKALQSEKVIFWETSAFLIQGSAKEGVKSGQSVGRETFICFPLKKINKSFPEYPCKIEGWGEKKVLSVWKCLWNCISLSQLEFLSVFIAQSNV